MKLSLAKELHFTKREREISVSPSSVQHAGSSTFTDCCSAREWHSLEVQVDLASSTSTLTWLLLPWQTQISHLSRLLSKSPTLLLLGSNDSHHLQSCVKLGSRYLALIILFHEMGRIPPL